MSKKNIIYFLVIAVVVVLRFVWLDRFPPGLSNDETEYVLSAKAYALHGRDVSGYGFPLSLFKSETDGVIAPIPPIMTSPLYLFLPLNLTTARIPYVLISIITVIGIYKLVLFLFKNQDIAIFTSLIYLMNPWSWYFSRNTADAPVALMFFLWGVFFLLKQKKQLLWPLLLFVLGFFSYHGAKLLFPPIIFVVLFYRVFIEKDLPWKKAAIFAISSGVFFVAFFLIASKIPGSVLTARSSDITNDQQQIVRLVDELRRQSIDTPLKNIFINKYIITFRILAQRYISAFNPSILFFSGDLRATYRFENYGLFHLFDILLIAAGVFYISKKWRRKLIFLILILAVTPLATMLSGVETSVINRAFLLLPFLIILSGLGFYYLFTMKKVFQAPLFLALVGSFLYFFNFYFFSFPVTAQENYWLSERVLMKYLDQEQDSVWVTREPWNSLMRAIFYSNQEIQLKSLDKAYPLSQTSEYKILDMLITGVCPNEIDPQTTYAITTRLNCHNEIKNVITIENQKDSGDVIRIVNPTVCEAPLLSSYRRYNKIGDYAIESMDRSNLCSKWFSKKY